MQVTTENNLFNVIAAHLVQSEMSELFLVADRCFRTIPGIADEVLRSLTVAERQFPSAVDALASHFNTCKAQTQESVFCNGCAGTIDVNGVLIEFTVKRISKGPETYRVLFSRVDVGALYAGLQQQVTTLAKQMQQLKRQGNRAK